jgi:orotidine-5'-phosphate decarboxylase
MTRKEIVSHIFGKGSYLIVGLDTDPSKLPAPLKEKKDGMLLFNQAIVEATKDFCVGYKINTAFYEAQGAKGWEIMAETAGFIPATHFKIADAKRGDIGNTSAQYAKAFFETLSFDAITVAPYMGEDSIRPFLEFRDKWTILLGLTSNPGAIDFEMQRLLQPESVKPAFVAGSQHTQYLYEHVLQKAADWGTSENLMFVIGATNPKEFSNIRQITPNHFYLVPGIGAQGGNLKDISEAAMISDCGLLVNASRAVIYASSGDDFAEAAAQAAAGYAAEMTSYLPKTAAL